MAKKKIIDLALQGGGSHGAFTWGVLDALLERTEIDIEAISATSAGAVNAAAMISGYAKGGIEGAKQNLHDLWHQLSTAVNPLQWHSTPFERMMEKAWENSPAYQTFESMRRMWSPSQFNPLNINPMRDILQSLVDFDALRTCKHFKLFVNATHVRTGKGHIFKPEHITLDVIMASACLPLLYQAVEIDGEFYWDGGYTGNPALYPLFYHTKSEDILIVQINPVLTDEVPTETVDILERTNDISFNASLMPEIRAVLFVKKLIEQGKLPHGTYKDVRLHLIETQSLMNNLGHASKMNLDWDFISHLRDLGRQTALDWLEAHFDDIGKKSSFDVEKIYL